jgi:plasmid stabilization system protein ParE
MAAYALGRDADLDLDDVWEYIAQDSIDAADRWIDKLFAAFEALARMPGIGHRRDDLTEQPSPIQIVSVTQGSRDIPSFLRRRMG